MNPKTKTMSTFLMKIYRAANKHLADLKTDKSANRATGENQ